MLLREGYDYIFEISYSYLLFFIILIIFIAKFMLRIEKLDSNKIIVSIVLQGTKQINHEKSH